MGKQMAACSKRGLPAWEAGATGGLGSAGVAASHSAGLQLREPLLLLASCRPVPRWTLSRLGKLEMIF